MEYKLIKKFLPELNLNYQAGDYSADAYVVTLSTLEAELAKGVEVFGTRSGITFSQWQTDTHSGLLLNYKPIESSKPVSREEIQRTLSESAPEYILEGLLKRILENGVK